MNPLKPKHIVKLTAEKLGLDETDVQSVVSAYWQDEIRKKLSAVEHTSLDIPLLGSMSLKPHAVDRMVEKIQRELDRFDPVYSPAYMGARARQKIQELNVLETAQSLIAFDRERQNHIKQSRIHEKSD